MDGQSIRESAGLWLPKWLVFAGKNTDRAVDIPSLTSCVFLRGISRLGVIIPFEGLTSRRETPTSLVEVSQSRQSRRMEQTSIERIQPETMPVSSNISNSSPLKQAERIGTRPDAPLLSTYASYRTPGIEYNSCLTEFSVMLFATTNSEIIRVSSARSRVGNREDVNIWLDSNYFYR